MKHHLVYKITNNLNGMYYIGVHSTDNIQDDYMSTRHNTNHGVDIDKDDLKCWEKQL